MRAFGVQSLVYGGLGVCLLGPFNMLYAAGAEYETDWGRVFAAITLHGAIVFALSILLLAIGFGQVHRRTWAARWSLVWAYAALFAVGLMVAISLRVTDFVAAPSTPLPGITMWDFPLVLLYLFPHCLCIFSAEIPHGVPAAILALCYAPYPLAMLLRFSSRGPAATTLP